MRNGLLFALAPAAALVVVACSAKEPRSGFYTTSPAAGGESGPSQGFTGSDGGGPCVGLECKVVECTGGATTSLKGTVYDPAGATPLYNVMVYIPSGSDPEQLPEMKDSTKEPNGITCETCASMVVNPLRSTLTDAKGAFVLEDVPVGAQIPLVIQIGKWRRLVHVDVTKECAANEIPNHDLRLPRNGNEGNLPQIAVTTGEYDALECLLRGIGIDDNEFVSGHGGAGHVHMFKGYGGGMGAPAEDFWNEASQLRKYDMVLLSCEGDEHNELKAGDAAGARGSMYEYLNAGGKVFATHFHYTWFKNSPLKEFRDIAEWGMGSLATEYEINQTFPKGKKFAEWLHEVGVSSTLGRIKLEKVTHSIKAVRAPATGWIQAPNNTAKYMSFNTPISAKPDDQCGRAVLSDVHMTDKAGPPAIKQCGVSSGGLNNQQTAIEFLFFDLSACVSDDKVAPQPPK